MIGAKIKHQLRKIYSFINSKNLNNLAIVFGSDKFGYHHYIQHYQNHFAKIRHLKLNILEIGIGGYDKPENGGQSLRMWKAFFPSSNIFGIDIYDKSCHDEKRIKTFRGSQVDFDFLKNVKDEIGNIDIIIDDGSHFNEHVVATFKFLFPLLSENGIYVIEDTQTSYWEEVNGVKWGGSSDLDSPNTLMNFFKSLVDGLNFEEYTLEGYKPNYFDRHIISIHFYHNLIFIYKGLNNEGSNILKKSSDLDLNIS